MWTMSSGHNGPSPWAQAKHRTHGVAQSSNPKGAVLTLSLNQKSLCRFYFVLYWAARANYQNLVDERKHQLAAEMFRS